MKKGPQAPFLTSQNICMSMNSKVFVLQIKAKKFKYALNFVWTYTFYPVHWLEVTGIQNLKIFLIASPQNIILTFGGRILFL